MAQYFNWLIKNGEPLKAVLVRLHNKNGGLVSTDVTDEFGHYSFNNIPQGTYNLKFYGNNLTTDDWLYNIEVIDASDVKETARTLVIKDYLSQYRWADTLFIEDFTNNSKVSYATYPDGTNIIFSDGFSWEGNTGGIGTAVITITNNISTNLIPYNISTTIDPLPYWGNRGNNIVSYSGIFTGDRSLLFIGRVSQAGVTGTAKLDILNNGKYLSRDNIIYQNTPITIASGLSFVFEDTSPIFLHDTWAIRAISPHINKLTTFIDYEFDNLIDEVRIILSGITDRKADLDNNINTIVFSGVDFGTTKEYLVDWDPIKSGKDFHIQLRITRSSTGQKIKLNALYALFGDSEEYTYWNANNV